MCVGRRRLRRADNSRQMGMRAVVSPARNIRRVACYAPGQRGFTPGLGKERGAVILIVMIFCMSFLIVGFVMYWLSASQIRSTETERTDSKVDAFVQVSVYDNSAGGVTVDIPPEESQRVAYDANGDGKMYVDATSSGDDDRPRILVLVDNKKWYLPFSGGTALSSSALPKGTATSVAGP
jgi:hypothetical protein